MSWPTQYDRDRFRSSPGKRCKPLYASSYDDAGRLVLKKTGEEDLYDFIQSHAESVDINVILAKYAAGDASVLSRRQGVYADFSAMPGTYAEMLNMVHQAEASFDALPLETRQAFDMSMSNWLASYGSEEWIKKMGIDVPAADVSPAAPEVETDGA